MRTVGVGSKPGVASRGVWSVAALLGTLVLIIGPAAATAQQPEGAPVVVGDVLVDGNARHATATIVAEAGLRQGMTITYRDVQRAIHRLWRTGQYEDVQIRALDAAEPGAPVTLVIQVVEQPYVARIEFHGLENVRSRQIQDTVGLQARGPYQPSRVRAAESITRQLLASQGFQVRRFEHSLEELPDRPGEYLLRFDVDEGRRIALSDVEFEGNSAFTTEQLRRTMSTRPEGFFWFRSGIYDPAKLREDLQLNLPDFYAEHGYIDFAVLGDSLVVDGATGKARLIIGVDEGPQYRLAEFDVRGNRRFSTDQLLGYFERERGGLLSGLRLGGRSSSGAAEEGTVFDRLAFDNATERLYQLYRNQGYLHAQINPIIERIENGDGEPAVRVAWEIREGEPAYVNRVSIAGNTVTHERVIREQILVLPGDVYNEELLAQSYQRIMALGFFETPLPFPRMEPTEDGDVDITFKVEERQTGSINFGTSMGGGIGLAGFLGYEQPNLFGQARAGRLHWEFGRFVNNFEARYSDPSLFGSRVSGSVSLFNSRDRFFQFAEGQRRRTGAGLRVGLPLPIDPVFSRFMIGYTVSRTSYEDFTDDPGSIFAQEPGVQSTVTVGIARNLLNHPMFPTEGTRQEVEAAFTGGILGGDGEFQRYTASGSWYVPLGQVGGGQPGSRPVRFTLGLNAEAGALFGDARSLSRFPFERFWMGGVQFGRPLRGYEETTITPRGHIPRGTPGISLADRFGDAYLRLGAETAVRFSDNVSFSLFYDAGNVWRRPGEINPTRLMRGAGLGVMLITPFGPIGVDYAYGFDKLSPGWKLHFRMGPQF